jgi:hypothetical protein
MEAVNGAVFGRLLPAPSRPQSQKFPHVTGTPWRNSASLANGTSYMHYGITCTPQLFRGSTPPVVVLVYLIFCQSHFS